MDFETWQRNAPDYLRADPLWHRQDYRLASYVADSAWPDAELLASHPATRGISGQLFEAAGSIASHIAEGYSRGSPADRVRFYEYALGSARETREWYVRGRGLLGDERVRVQATHLSSIVRLLLTVIPSERARPKGPGGMTAASCPRTKAAPPREEHRQ